MNNTLILLRSYDEVEIEDLRQLERAAHRRYLSLKEYEKFAAAPAINAERFRIGTTRVAEFAGHRAGYIIVQPLDGMLYIASLMVDDGMSGKGIGQRLLDWAEDYASCRWRFGGHVWLPSVPRGGMPLGIGSSDIQKCLRGGLGLTCRPSLIAMRRSLT